MSSLARKMDRRHNMEKNKLDIKTLDDKISGIVKSANETLREIRAIVTEQNKRIGELEKLQQKIATFAAAEFGKVLGHQQTVAMEFANTTNHIDMNVLALAEVAKEIFGQLAQIDHVLQTSIVKPSTDSGDLKLDLNIPDGEASIETIKTKAVEWYNQVTKSAFKIVNAQREQHAEKMRQEEAALKKEAEEAAQAKTEAEVVEKELRSAEAPGVLMPASGGEGSNIPEGADVFGG